jgi:hypothetical protein
VLGGSRRRLGGIGLGYLFLGASHFKYHVGAAAKLVLAAPLARSYQCFLARLTATTKSQTHPTITGEMAWAPPTVSRAAQSRTPLT